MINRKLLMMIVSVGMVTFFSTSVGAAAQSKRLWGNNRYETCSAIVQEGWRSGSYYAVIVNGENFPDALSAASLAKKYNAPILLTQDNTLNSNTATELKRLGVKNVFIVGGEAVISPKVEKEISNLGIQTTRYKGEDRADTSIKVAEQIGTQNGIIVTTGSDYTDALSAAPIAAGLQIPIILVSKDEINTNLRNFIFKNHIPKTYVLGDSDIISDRVAGLFPNVKRIEGKDKYERNINIIKAFEDKISFNNVCLAYSEKFADALSGAAFAANNGNPIVLVGDQTSAATNDFIKNKINSINNFTVLGGTAGIGDSLVNELSGGSNSSGNSSQVLSDNEGNSSGNLRNGGFVVEKDGWIYYVKNNKKIYRIRPNGTEETAIADVKNARSINVVDNYLYYVGSSNAKLSNSSEDTFISIFKISTNGGYGNNLISEEEESVGQGYPYIKVVDHSVYYSPNLKYIGREGSNFYDGFYKMDTETRESNQSASGYFKSMATYNGFVYFTMLDDNRIRKMPVGGNKKKDGTQDNKEVDLGLNGTILDVINGYIYYNDADGNTYKIKEDKSEKTKITSLPEKFIINGDWVYYVVPGSDNLYELRKMRLDGTQDTGLNAYKVESFSITGDWLYYRNSGNGNIYRMRLDGTGKEQFPGKISVKTVNDINVKIKKGDTYNLPRAIPATMDDESSQYFTVTWDKDSIDTSMTGKYEIYGSVDGYTSKVKLTVEVTN